MQAMPTARLFTDAQELLDYLAMFKTIHATRLHANVLAWVSGCADIQPLVYDEKVTHFFERVAGMKPKDAKKIIEHHLSEINHIISCE
jgi:hypothetical protein